MKNKKYAKIADTFSGV